MLCAVLAAAPVTWQWNANRVATSRFTRERADLEMAFAKQEQLSNEIDRLTADSARLDTALGDALNHQTIPADAA